MVGFMTSSSTYALVDLHFNLVTSVLALFQIG